LAAEHAGHGERAVHRSGGGVPGRELRIEVAGRQGADVVQDGIGAVQQVRGRVGERCEQLFERRRIHQACGCIHMKTQRRVWRDGAAQPEPDGRIRFGRAHVVAQPERGGRFGSRSFRCPGCGTAAGVQLGQPRAGCLGGIERDGDGGAPGFMKCRPQRPEPARLQQQPCACEEGVGQLAGGSEAFDLPLCEARVERQRAGLAALGCLRAGLRHEQVAKAQIGCAAGCLRNSLNFHVNTRKSNNIELIECTEIPPNQLAF
jgi:hypothetical protein